MLLFFNLYLCNTEIDECTLLRKQDENGERMNQYLYTKEEFCENIRLYRDSMFALAFTIVRNEQDAADVVGEAVIRAYCNLHQLKNKHSFKPWVLTIVHNTALEMLRKRCVTVDIDEQWDLAEAPEKTDISTKLVLREAVEKLNQPYSTVVILYYYEEMSILEIAKITGASVVAVKKQLSRARKMLRKSLDKEDFFG